MKEKRQLPAGNTNTRSRSLTFFITNFNDEFKHFEKAIYDLSCEDTTKDGKHHWHQLIKFTNPISFNTIKKEYPTAHIEKPHNIFDTINYIKSNKNGRKYNIVELGTEPINTQFKKVSDFKDCAVDDIPPHYLSAYLKYLNLSRPLTVANWNKQVEVLWITGPSGIGKSSKACELIGSDDFDLVKFDGSFWSGVSNMTNKCIYDDFRDSHMKPSEFINFIDYRKQRMNVKGGSTINEYEKIIITSIQDPRDIYNNLEYERKEQWLRRIKIIDLTPIDSDAF